MKSQTLQNPLNEHGFAFPLLERVHVAGIVCGSGVPKIKRRHVRSNGAARRPVESRRLDPFPPFALAAAPANPSPGKDGFWNCDSNRNTKLGSDGAKPR